MDGHKTIKVTNDGPKWSAIKKGATHAFMGLDDNGVLVRAKETGVYMFMN